MPAVSLPRPRRETALGKSEIYSLWSETGPTLFRFLSRTSKQPLLAVFHFSHAFNRLHENIPFLGASSGSDALPFPPCPSFFQLDFSLADPTGVRLGVRDEMTALSSILPPIHRGQDERYDTGVLPPATKKSGPHRTPAVP